MKKDNLRVMTVSAVFAAAIAITTGYVLHIPLPTGGYIHVGDALIYLSACLLPMPWAMLTGAMGGAVADLLTAPIWALPTFFIKAVICLPFTRKTSRLISVRNVAAVFISGILSPVLYACVNVILTQTWNAFLPQLIGTLVQSAGSGIVFILLAFGCDRVDLKTRIFPLNRSKA